MNNRKVLVSAALLVIYSLINGSSFSYMNYMLFSYDKFQFLDQYEKANFISPLLRIVVILAVATYVYISSKKIKKNSVLNSGINTLTMILSMELLVRIVESTFKYYQMSNSEMAVLGLVNFTEPFKADLVQKLGLLGFVILVYFVLNRFILNIEDENQSMTS